MENQIDPKILKLLSKITQVAHQLEKIDQVLENLAQTGCQIDPQEFTRFMNHQNILIGLKRFYFHLNSHQQVAWGLHPFFSPNSKPSSKQLSVSDLTTKSTNSLKFSSMSISDDMPED